jgi:hypothetical protein
MSFSKLRNALGIKNNGLYKFELNRFCNKIGYNIVGGASRLLSFFMKNFKYEQIISYFDKSLGSTSFYEKIGFKFIGETPINYHYIKSGLRLHRYNYRKDKLVKMGYDKSLTESQITNSMNLLRIYGPGNYKYIISIN